MTYVLLPVSRAVYDEIAEQVRLRGQPDRIDDHRLRINLADVVIELNEAKMLTDPKKGL